MELTSDLLKKAYQIAEKAHEGQLDKAGVPYILHPLHVANDVETEELQVVALLHDVIEDTDWTAEDLIRNGIPEELVKVVCLLTHDKEKHVTYMEYIADLCVDERARKVKMADLRHNMQISRIPEPTRKDYKRMELYRKAYALIEKTEEKKMNEYEREEL